MSVGAKREIIKDFARVISEKRTQGPKPATIVINFRNEKKDQFERDVYLVPVVLLRYRKDNDLGKARQLAADVQSRAHAIEGDIYDYMKKRDGLGKKNGKTK